MLTMSQWLASFPTGTRAGAGRSAILAGCDYFLSDFLQQFKVLRCIRCFLSHFSLRVEKGTHMSHSQSRDDKTVPGPGSRGPWPVRSESGNLALSGDPSAPISGLPDGGAWPASWLQFPGSKAEHSRSLFTTGVWLPQCACLSGTP